MHRPSPLVLALVLVAAGCGGRAPAPPVRAVAAPPGRTPSGPTTTVTAADEPSAEPEQGVADPVGPATDALRARVDAALLRYDLALTGLAAHPDRAGDPAAPERTAWAGVVVPGSALDDAMVEEVVRRATEEDGAVLPPPGGLSYRHTALSARAVDGTVEFTWCGHSPGIGVERSSGTVVDDAVGHSHGTGRLQPAPGTDLVAQLDQTELEVLPAGTPDPCPGEVRP